MAPIETKLYFTILLLAWSGAQSAFQSKLSTQLIPRRQHSMCTGRCQKNRQFQYVSNQLKKMETTNSVALKVSSDGSAQNGSIATSSRFSDYLNVLRPVTIVQAVGALIVGYLAFSSGQSIAAITAKPVQFISASLSVYLSYGCGMLMNDLIDIDSDALHDDKQDRAIASGRISKKAGWMYCMTLSIISLLLGNIVSVLFASWTAGNLSMMLAYALGLQKVFLVKNIICGWLAISPLIGASILSESLATVSLVSISKDAALAKSRKLYSLATIGFPMQVSREILKDAEDIEIDRGMKQTLPLVIGIPASHRIAYGLVAFNIGIMVFTPIYWKLFTSALPIFPIGIIVGVPMCVKAALLPLDKGQRLLKKSIYVLLASMIGSLSIQ